MIIVLLLGTGGTWAVLGYRVSSLEESREEQKAVNKIVIQMQTDISWIRLQMENKEK